jgi:hypothetical protein
MAEAHDEIHLEDKATAGRPPSPNAHDELHLEDSTSLPDLRQEWIDLAVSWLQEKWGDDKGCPMCGNPKWTVSHVGAIPEWVPNVGLSFRVGYPVVPVSCTNCGFVALINAIAAGIFPDTEGQQ